MKIVPLADRCLIKAVEAQTETAGGLILPEKLQDSKGEVINVGEGLPDDKMYLKPGDTVLYNAGAGTKITVEGIDYLLMRQRDVLAKIK